jgi:hypothetical protein
MPHVLHGQDVSHLASTCARLIMSRVLSAGNWIMPEAGAGLAVAEVIRVMRGRSSGMVRKCMVKVGWVGGRGGEGRGGCELKVVGLGLDDENT